MSDAATFSAGTLVSALVHGAALIFLFSAFGALLFLTVVGAPAIALMEPREQARAERRSAHLAAWSLALGALWEIAWLVVESAVLAGAGLAALPAAVAVVASHTEFGHLVLAQVAFLVCGLVVLGKKRNGVSVRLAAALSGIAVLLEAWHLHAAAMDPKPSFFLACEALHVLAAAAWLGSLLPLALLIRAAPPKVGLAAALRYSAFAKPAVVALMVTAAFQGLVLVGSIPAFFTTAYGRVVVVKIVLFAILIGFALRHRFRMVPALADADRGAMRRHLGRSVFAETGFGVAIVVVAAVLASLAPPTMAAMAMH
ncbi:MAG: CopD family protein [Acetobacteraceae bacterium]